MLVEGKKKLEMILGNQRNFGKKQGIGFDPFHFKNNNKTTFVRASHQKYTPRRTYPRGSYSRNRITCNYCGRYGHSINKCCIRNNSTRFKQIWVPKDELNANKNELKKVWVPKGAT